MFHQKKVQCLCAGQKSPNGQSFQASKSIDTKNSWLLQKESKKLSDRMGDLNHVYYMGTDSNSTQKSKDWTLKEKYIIFILHNILMPRKQQN